MVESVLVADYGIVAGRVIAGCRRLGIKSVAVGLSTAADGRLDGDGRPIGFASRNADDVVLLSDLDELSDPDAVLGAAMAAGVDVVHPGRGPLRTDVAWAAHAARVGVRAVVSDVGAAATPYGGPDVTEVTFLIGRGGCIELGTVSRRSDGALRSPSTGDGGQLARLRQVARAAVTAPSLQGMVTVGLDGARVIGLDGGLPAGQAAIEAATGLDLLELQLAELDVSGSAVVEAGNGAGVAVSRGQLDVVADVRLLSADYALSFDVLPLYAHGHEGLVWATALGRDESAARTAIDRHISVVGAAR